MELPDLRNFDLAEKKILVRVDYDVLLKRREGPTSPRLRGVKEKAGGREGEWVVVDETRIENSLDTIKYLLGGSCKIILLSHLGRPGGKKAEGLSLEPVFRKLQEMMPEVNIKFHSPAGGPNDQIFKDDKTEVVLLENLRFNPGEEANDLGFAKGLSSLGDFYINEAFGVSHREHASIATLPKLLPHAAGLSLLKEVRVLSSVWENPKRPVIFILGGGKADKLDAIPGLLKFADKILVGGKLPFYKEERLGVAEDGKVLFAGLNDEGKDITLEALEEFCQIVEKAGTIVWAGPMGAYEDSPPVGGWELGTREIGRAVVNSGAFTIVGGGDTEAALTKFGLVDKIDFVSSGGGACLEFLALGDLPGLKALRNL
ncbi:MAG: phosphoglycerate kinase [bacterium]|nr:phosphoglycerate kinase [bacterium]